MAAWTDDNGNRWIDNMSPLGSGNAERPTQEMLRRGEVRRRIEDIKEASRLEDDVFGEVWDE